MAVLATLVLIAIPRIIWPPRPQTVVVTPIENLTGTPGMDLDAAGLTQDLLSTLAQGCKVNIVESRLMDASRVPNRNPRELGREYGAHISQQDARACDVEEVKVFGRRLTVELARHARRHQEACIGGEHDAIRHTRREHLALTDGIAEEARNP